MAYIVNQKVLYTSPNGKQALAIIKTRKIDFKEGYIDKDNASGNFDYLIHFEEGNKEPMFCDEEDLREILRD